MTWALAVLSAILLALVFPGPIQSGGWWPVATIALAPLVVAAAREPRPLRRFWIGWLAGAVFWGSVCYWIQYVLAVHGGMGSALGSVAFILFALYKGLHFAVFTLLCGYLVERPRVWTPVAIAALFTGIERTHGTFGFAWLTLGNSAIDVPLLARIAPVTGVYGITFLFAMCAASLACGIAAKSWRPAVWPIAGILAAFLFPAIPPPLPPDRGAVLVQPNAPEEPPWNDRQWQTASAQLFRISEETAGSTTDLIVWPETPAPIYYFDDPQLQAQAHALARNSKAFFLLGTVARAPGGEPLNSSVLLAPDGRRVGQYSKINLVPFGEFVPPLFSWVNKVTKEAGDYAPGIEQTVFSTGSHSLSTFICYESAFPDFVRTFANRGAELLVNISNDGYFGGSFAREQHLELVRMRALENNRWILRAANDGITVAVDPSGRVTDRFPPYRQLASRISFRFVPETTLYTRRGDWFAWLCLVVSLIATAAMRWSPR